MKALQKKTTVKPSYTLLKPESAQKYIERGANSIMNDAKAAGALVKIGRSNLIVMEKLMAFYESKVV